MMKAVRLVAAVFALFVLALAIGGGTGTSAATPTRVYPIVDVGSNFLLGGSAQGNWLTPDVMSNTVAGGESYRVYSLKGYLGRSTGTLAVPAGEPCEDVQSVDLQPSRQNTGSIAVASTWAAMPRLPRTLSNTTPVYVKAVSDLLKARGIATPNVNIEQVLQVDLEGDGVKEVLVSATYFAGSDNNEPIPSITPGDYSITFMRKLVAGKVETVVLAEDVHTEQADFAAPSKYKIAGVMDLNGDGTMEVVLNGSYYEGAWTSVLQIKGTQFEEVLSAGCGA
jgi:hypothetical protein